VGDLPPWEAFFLLHPGGVRRYSKNWRGPLEKVRASLFIGREVPMKKGMILTIFLVLFGQAWIQGEGGSFRFEPQEAASAPVPDLRPIHPLPEWNGQENIRPRTGAPEEGSNRRLKITFPVALLATLLFFLMWKFLQGQE
jgi:hypothetical protein